MGEMIQKPDINPIIVAIANWIGLGGVEACSGTVYGAILGG